MGLLGLTACTPAVRKDGVKGRAKVNKEEACVAPLVLQVRQGSMERCR